MTANDVTLPAKVGCDEPPGRAGQSRIWRRALVVAFVLLAALGWLLARLVWLYYYFGLFFFMVAGLLVGAIAFRLARPARPLTTVRILAGALLVALSATLVTAEWEYRHFAAGAGDPPHFAEARNRSLVAGRSTRTVQVEATRAFDRVLKERFAPGGLLGYVRWAVTQGEMRLRLPLGPEEETITMPHQGLRWPVRTTGGMLLMALGLWFSFEALRSPQPVSNVLPPGAEYEEDV